MMGFLTALLNLRPVFPKAPLSVICCLLALGFVLTGADPLSAQSKVLLERQGFPMAFQNGSRVVTFERRPDRILALGLGAAELLAELGLDGFVVGHSLTSPSEKPLPKYAQALARIPNVKLDDILSAETGRSGPDFIFGKYDPVLADQPFLNSYHTLARNKAQFYMEVRDLAKLFAAEDKAGEFIAAQEKKLSSLSDRLAHADRIPVMVISGLRNGSFKTYGGQDFTTDLLSLAGGENVFGYLGTNPELPAERAARHKPVFVLLVDDGKEPVEEKLEALRGDPNLAQLPAIAEGRLFTIEEAYLLPGPRLAESAEILARHLHPSLFD
jgi:iron complex transport system substrate-binding protein